MKDKKQQAKRPIVNPRARQKPPVRKPLLKEGDSLTGLHWLHWLFIPLIAIVTFICFQPAAGNHFLKTWDDEVYVTSNKLLNGLNAKNISEIFSFHKDLQKLTKNYHPLTTLSLSVNHQVAGLNPQSYYLTNIFIHILNSILVYLLIFLLSERKIWAALFSGLLFGIHPMHVESVAWISERKDVLYAFFFISAMISYYFYIKKNRMSFLVLAFLLFLLSVLSKAMAVVFPLVLFLMDLLLARRWSYRVLVEKIPFFIISVFFGLLAVRIQADGAITDWQTFTLLQRVMHASYGFLAYLGNFFLPANLSAFYPYPFIDAQGLLPWTFRLAPFVVAGILAGSTALLFMKNRMMKVTGTGLLFFFVTLMLVLQFLSVGKAITADRYTYLPYIGICFIIGSWGTTLVEQKKIVLRTAGMALWGMMLALTVFSAIQTRHRSAVWHDDFTLWHDALDQYPDVRMNFIRCNLAKLNLQNGDYHVAMKEYQKVCSLEPANGEALERIGQIYGQFYHRMDSSLVFLNKAFQVSPDNASLLKNLGVAYAVRGDYGKSLDFFLNAYKKLPADSALIQNISMTYKAMGNSEKSNEFAKLVHQKN